MPEACGGSCRRQEHFLLAYQDVRVHNVPKEKTRVMRNILFWLLMLVVLLALAGC
jgi:hypothetical protein